MVKSKCPKCDHPYFEFSENSPPFSGGAKFYLIQCSKCGSVVGVTDIILVRPLIEKLEKKIDFLMNKLLEIEKKVDGKK